MKQKRMLRNTTTQYVLAMPMQLMNRKKKLGKRKEKGAEAEAEEENDTVEEEEVEIGGNKGDIEDEYADEVREEVIVGRGENVVIMWLFMKAKMMMMMETEMERRWWRKSGDCAVVVVDDVGDDEHDCSDNHNVEWDSDVYGHTA
ncbi:hypothetical protein EWB00_001694, partial [Schistosoma japonicum]